MVELRRDASSPAYSPLDEEAVVSGDYALSRYLYFYIDGKPQGDLRDYVLWAISEDGGQPIAVEVGFYALPESVVQDNIQRIG